MQDFRNLRVWEKAHDLTKQTYKLTKTFPKKEMYGLVSQTRRACVSIPTNIAEGCGRYTDRDFTRFLQISMGSACEVEYLLLLANELNYLDDDNYKRINKDLIEVKKMLSSLIKVKRN
jgi:four helix bundle protein